jgi:hypothetical protein
MPKNKRPVPRKPQHAPEEPDDALSQALAELARQLVGHDGGAEPGEAQRQQELELQRMIRKLLQQKNDDVLYDAIERTRYDDIAAYQFLRGQIEEASSTVVVRREGMPAMEINAFVVPLFVRSSGGLRQADGFVDADAFEQLVASFQHGGLESDRAKVVLINHAYDRGEIDRISFCDLGAMVRDAYASMSEKKLVATPALEASMSGWGETDFAPDDAVVELRFLLGFALKRVDDPFYAVPAGEAAADAYFEARMQRYQQWAGQAAPLLKRCLAFEPDAIEINFLYQDLFHGGKEQGMAEYATLQMMAEINQVLREHKLGVQDVRAVVGPSDLGDELVLRVQLLGKASGALLASCDKPLDVAALLQVEIDDLCDALATLGIGQLAVALRFEADGRATDPVAYAPPA